MTNEAVLKLRLEEPWDWIVHNSDAIEKGTLMKMSGVGIAAANDGSGDIWAGIAQREKITIDGRTRLALYRRGIVDMVNCVAGVETIAQGQWVTSSGPNLIRAMTAGECADSSGIRIGIAREDIAAAGTGEIILGG